jgi:hypothetical protein
VYFNPDKDKRCNHCKKKGHVDTRCWKKHPELIPDKVKVARKKQAEKESKMSSTAAKAIKKGDIILNVIKLEDEIYHFDMNDAYFTVPIKEDSVYLQNNDKESKEESDNKESDNYDQCPHVTLLDRLAEVEPEVQDNDI